MAVNTTFQNITLRVGNIQGDRNVYVYAKQYDAASRYLLVDLRDDNGRVEVGGTPQLNAIKPDGTFSYTAGSIEETGLMLFELSSQVLAVPGKVECDISVFGSETELVDLFRGDGINSVFHLHYVFSEITSVKIAGTETSDYTFDSTNQTITFTTVPAVTSSIVVEGTGKSLLTSSTFFVIVSRSAYNPEAIESSDEFTTLSEAIEAANACIAKEVVREANEAQRILNEEGRVAAEAAREAKWGSATATATSIPAAQDASVSVTQDSSGTHFAFGIPTGNGIASITKTGTSGNVDTYTITFTNGTTQTYEVTNGASTVKVGGVVQSEINFDSDPQEQLDQKANVDGYYETLGAGYADQLISPDGVTDTPETDADYNPFVFRPTSGSTSVSSGNASIEQIRGNSIVWNQLLENGNFVDASGWTAYGDVSSTIADNTYTITFTKGSSSSSRFFKHLIEAVPANHKVLISLDINTLVPIRIGLQTFSSTLGTDPYTMVVINTAESTGTWLHKDFMYTNSDSRNCLFIGTRSTTASIEDPTCMIRNVQVFDITQMFGSEFADAMYESRVDPTSEAGDLYIDWFRNLFPNNYYEYDPGTIKNITASALRTIEFNAWDEEWEGGSFDPTTGEKVANGTRIRSKNYIPVIPGATYYLKVPAYGNIFEYDADKKYLKYTAVTNATCVFSEDTHYVRILTGSSSIPVTTYNNDICLNLSHSGYRDGEYEPYKTHTLSLPTSTYFPDGMNGVGTVYDEINFKTRKAIKRFGIVDLGTLDYRKSVSPERFEATTSIPSKNTFETDANGICTNYLVLPFASVSEKDNVLFVNNSGYVRIYDSSKYTLTVSEFKAAMSGVYLIYELATPVETDIPESVNNTYIESDFGTEEFVYSETDIPIKVPCEIKYIDNLKEKLRNLNPMTTAELNEVLTILD